MISPTQQKLIDPSSPCGGITDATGTHLTPEEILRAREGEASAREKLFRVLRADIVSYCRRWGATQEESEDVAQEYLEALLFDPSPKIDSFDPRRGQASSVSKKFYGFVFCTARQLFFRRISRLRNNGVSLEVIPDIAGSASNLETEEMLHRIHDALRTGVEKKDLLPVHVLAFSKAKLAQLSYRKTAEDLGVSVGYVGTLIHQARRYLDKWMEENGLG